MKYSIITFDDAILLQEAIENLSTDGWVCQGGVSITILRSTNERKGYSESTFFYAQAMVKE